MAPDKISPAPDPECTPLHIRHTGGDRDNSAESEILWTEENKFNFRSNAMRMLINKTNCFSKIIATDDGVPVWLCIGLGCFDIIQADKGQV